MGEPVVRPATYQDILDAPPHLVAEIIGGRLVTHPRPRPRHGYAQTVLSATIGRAFHRGLDDGPGGWCIVHEPELHLDEDVLVPNIAGWHRERIPVSADPDWRDFPPPDWVCEVISPSTVRYDRQEKRAIYARHGVTHLWFVDPDAKTLEAFELTNGAWIVTATHADDDTIAVRPFDAVPFSLAALWAE